MKEIWKDVPGFEGKFIASDLGNVKNLKTGKINWRGLVGRNVYYRTCSIGYIHIIVALTFLPNPDNKPEVGHKDNDPLNNKVENLNWVTHSENQQNSKENISIGKQGEKHFHTKLTNNNALNIIEMRRQKIRYKVIAKKYDVTENSLVSLVTRGWSHLKPVIKHYY